MIVVGRGVAARSWSVIAKDLQRQVHIRHIWGAVPAELLAFCKKAADSEVRDGGCEGQRRRVGYSYSHEMKKIVWVWEGVGLK